MLPALLFFVFAFSPSELYAKAAAEEKAPPLNGEWTICITAFDISALPASRRILGDMLIRDLAAALEKADRRYRSGEETAYYEDYAMAKTRADAAKALSNKRSERDLLLYQGDPDWRYRKNLKTKDADIAKLEEALQKLDAEKADVNPEPFLKLSEENTRGNWPAPPVSGGEYRFCMAQKADAFLIGDVSEYYGRILLRLKMYTLHAKSYNYEDRIIFSPEDFSTAMAELSSRIGVAVSGVEPSGIIVHASPSDAMVLVGDAYAGRGEVPLQEYPPGEVEVALHAENYASTSFPLELNSGEIADISLDLNPLPLSSFTVNVPGSPLSSVYLGSLYLGHTPLDVELPRDRFSYLSVETPEGETGSVAFQGGSVVRGNAMFVNSQLSEETSLTSLEYETFVPIDPAEKRVDTKRRQFYGAYGRFWVVLPLSLVAIGMAESYVNAYESSMGSSTPHPEMYSKAEIANYTRIGIYALIGIAAVDTVFRIVRYLYTSSSDSTPIVRFGP
jgi:hypothetical protein